MKNIFAARDLLGGRNVSPRALRTSFALAAFLLVAGIVAWCSRPDYEVLFSGLSARDVGPILEELSEAGARTRLSENGRTILVESSRVAEMRLRVAGKGLTGSETVGYEMFGRTASERSELLEKAGYRRALEAELARTVMSIEAVQRARVHLAIAERGEDTPARKPAASLIVELRPGARLAKDQVQGIRALISASVDGLEPEGVSVVDSSGRLLGDRALNADLAATSDQLRVQREIEETLRQKAISILEPAVGPGGAIVQVTATLDFDRVERNVEVFNPSTTSLRSEQRITGPAGDSEDTILSTYEVDKTVEHILGGVGSIRRLSIAVLVDGPEATVASGKNAAIDRSAEELEKLAAMVRSAVGFTEDRGDVLEIANVRFADSLAKEAGSPLPWWIFFPSLGSHLNSFVILLAIGLVAWGLRRSSIILVRAIEDDRRLREEALAPDTSPAARSEAIRKQMKDLAHERPGEVASVVRRWLVEENAP